jgi:hypothetical protein
VITKEGNNGRDPRSGSDSLNSAASEFAIIGEAPKRVDARNPAEPPRGIWECKNEKESGEPTERWGDPEAWSGIKAVASGGGRVLGRGELVTDLGTVVPDIASLHKVQLKASPRSKDAVTDPVLQFFMVTQLTG